MSSPYESVYAREREPMQNLCSIELGYRFRFQLTDGRKDLTNGYTTRIKRPTLQSPMELLEAHKG